MVSVVKVEFQANHIQPLPLLHFIRIPWATNNMWFLFMYALDEIGSVSDDMLKAVEILEGGLDEKSKLQNKLKGEKQSAESLTFLLQARKLKVNRWFVGCQRFHSKLLFFNVCFCILVTYPISICV
jgi:hypothetical protein